jgi:hypothetical protein
LVRRELGSIPSDWGSLNTTNSGEHKQGKPMSLVKSRNIFDIGFFKWLIKILGLEKLGILTTNANAGNET